VSVSFEGHHGVRSTNHGTQTKHQDTRKWTKTSASHTRVRDRTENCYKRRRVRRLAMDFGSFLRLDFGTPSFDHSSRKIASRSLQSLIFLVFGAFAMRFLMSPNCRFQRYKVVTVTPKLFAASSLFFPEARSSSAFLNFSTICSEVCLFRFILSPGVPADCHCTWTQLRGKVTSAPRSVDEHRTQIVSMSAGYDTSCSLRCA